MNEEFWYTITDLARYIDEKYAGTSINKVRYIYHLGKITPTIRTMNGMPIWSQQDADTIRDNWTSYHT